MFNFLKTKLLNFWYFFFPKKLTKELKPKAKNLQPKKRNRTAYSHYYNQRDYVKKFKHENYLKNKERYYANKKKKRLLDRQAKKQQTNH